MGVPTVLRPTPTWPPAASDGTTTPLTRNVPSDVCSPGEDRRRNPEWRRHLVMLVQHEYSDLPGLHLSLAQAQRLFGLRTDICERILGELVREGFLWCDRTGVFTRRDIVA